MSSGETAVLPIGLSPAEGPRSRSGSSPGSRCNSRPSSPRIQRLPTQDLVGAALQNTVEDLINRDLDTSVLVDLANCPEAQRKMEDLLPIHFFSWELKNVQAALIYTLLHMFVLLGQHREMVGERGSYQDYVAQLKSRVADLEEELFELQQERRPEGCEEGSKEELLRLRRENIELRREHAKLQASQNEVG